MDLLLNDFATRCFRETADRDYIAARLAYRARLTQPYLWSALHCLEKYAKGVALYNRVSSKGIGHEVLKLIGRVNNEAPFQVELTDATKEYVERLEAYGRFRYFEWTYAVGAHDLIRLDRAVWELRRYCQPLNYEITKLDGTPVNLLTHNIERIRRGVEKDLKGTCITGGYLEDVVKNRNHQARAGLIWKNLFFGTSHRKGVWSLPQWESANGPLVLHPEIIDEVLKYCIVPKDVVAAARAELASRTAVKSGA